MVEHALVCMFPAGVERKRVEEMSVTAWSAVSVGIAIDVDVEFEACAQLPENMAGGIRFRLSKSWRKSCQRQELMKRLRLLHMMIRTGRWLRGVGGCFAILGMSLFMS